VLGVKCAKLAVGNDANANQKMGNEIEFKRFIGLTFP